MHAKNRVFPSVCASDDFYAILSVKKKALEAQRNSFCEAVSSVTF